MKNWKTVFFALLFSQSLIASTSEDLLKNLKSRFTDLPKGQGALMKSFTHHGQSYIYDQALGIIAFTNAGRQDDAKKLLTALRVLQHKDGSLYFSYYLDGSSPYPTEGDKRIAGAISWVALASVHYQAKFNSHEFKEFNKKILIYLKSQITEVYLNKNLIRAIKFAPQDILSTHFNESDVIALEHNLDAYAAYHLFDKVNKTKIWRNEIKELENFILAMWNKNDSHFWSGIDLKSNQIMKSELYLDNQTWTLLALDKDLLKMISPQKALDLNCELFYVEEKGLKGFMDSKPANRPSTHSFIWSEGTIGQVMAMNKIQTMTGNKITCNDYNIEDYISSVKRMKSEDGGIAYATQSKNPDFTTSSSVAGTAWLYFAINEINPFEIKLQYPAVYSHNTGKFYHDSLL